MNKDAVTIVIAVLAAVAAAVIAFSLVQQFAGNGPAQNFCTPQSREADACIQLYQPVCGWFDPAQVQCIRYPCAQTFSNSCFACMDGKVQYWTEGECPD